MPRRKRSAGRARGSPVATVMAANRGRPVTRSRGTAATVTLPDPGGRGGGSQVGRGARGGRGGRGEASVDFDTGVQQDHASLGNEALREMIREELSAMIELLRPQQAEGESEAISGDQSGTSSEPHSQQSSG